MAKFLAMGGYAVYVWSAYGAAALVLIALIVATLARRSGSRERLQALEQLRSRRRRT